MTLPHSLVQSKVNLLKTLHVRLTQSNHVMLHFHLFAAIIHDFLSRTNVNVLNSTGMNEMKALE